MLKFDNTHIVTGFIKQLLATFNLPQYRVYTREQEKFFRDNGYEKDVIYTVPRDDSGQTSHAATGGDDETHSPNNIRYAPYIKDGQVQRYEITENTPLGVWKENINWPYYYNKFEKNTTKNLQIKNNIYDSYTHEYLGDFLRFQRDYNNIDLMSMYNCFSNKLCNNLKLNFNIVHRDSSGTVTSTTTVKFDSTDKNYKIYMIPVKLFKEYTIAIDSSNAPVEIVCASFDKSLDNREKLTSIYAYTYKKYNSTKFNKPELYTKLLQDELDDDEIDALEIAQIEKNLKMFIKLPISNSSSITILEGNYQRHNDTLYRIKFYLDENGNKVLSTGSAPTGEHVSYEHSWERISNKIAVNTEQFDDDLVTFKPISRLQLLAINTGTSYPFADRLIEYLTGNAITQLDECPDNIRRVQKVMQLNNYVPGVYGLWEEKMRNVLYSFMKAHHDNFDEGFDILGFVDKDTEKYYYGFEKIERRAYETDEEYRQRSGGKHFFDGYYHNKITIMGMDLYNK